MPLEGVCLILTCLWPELLSGQRWASCRCLISAVTFRNIFSETCEPLSSTERWTLMLTCGRWGELLGRFLDLPSWVVSSLPSQDSPCNFCRVYAIENLQEERRGHRPPATWGGSWSADSCRFSLKGIAFCWFWGTWSTHTMGKLFLRFVPCLQMWSHRSGPFSGPWVASEDFSE